MVQKRQRAFGPFVGSWSCLDAASDRYLFGMDIRIKRIYDVATKGDGYRILVDRVWPRGVSREDAHLNEWIKDIGPSTELRKWFGHEPPKYAEFKKRYRKELQAHANEVERIRALARKQSVCLLYGAKDTQHNQAMVLCELLLAAK
jgi:uncharacterized protein YeaO (DUF488 family)